MLANTIPYIYVDFPLTRPALNLHTFIVDITVWNNTTQRTNIISFSHQFYFRFFIQRQLVVVLGGVELLVGGA